MKCPCCTSEIDRVNPVTLGPFLTMSGQKRLIYDLLAKSFGSFIPSERIIATMYAADSSGGPLATNTILKVQVCQLRKVLKPYGLTIIAAGGGGGRGHPGVFCDYALSWA